MKPILDTTSKRQRVKAPGQRAAVILTLFFGLARAWADSTDFMGAFDPTNWNSIPGGAGVSYFTNSDTKLAIFGPNPAPGGSSLDGMLYNGHLGGGLAVGGTVQFICDYAPEAITSGDAEFRWLEPGNDSPSVQVLGTYLTPVSGQLFTISSLPAGTIFGFYLSTDTSAGKVSATLTITDFQFLDVPEPSTGALLASMLAFLGAARWRRARIQARGLCQASSTH